MQLSIDTSTRHASVALFKNGQTLIENNWHSKKNHSVELVPNIKKIFDQSGRKQSSLDCIFVLKGPGSFSALRVGVSVAKAIALALNIPLISVNSLDVEFEPFKYTEKNTWAIIPAGKQKYYVGMFAQCNTTRNKSLVLNVMSHQEVIQTIPYNINICGEAALEIHTNPMVKEKQIQLLSPPPPTRKSPSIYNLCNEKLINDLVENPLTLQPIYLKSSQIANANRNLK